MIERTCHCGAVVACKTIRGRIPCRSCKPVPPCSIEGCELPECARGWCMTHYSRWRNNGDPDTVRKSGRRPSGPCAVSGCVRKVTSFGLCRTHYAAQRQYGDPLGKRPTRPTACKVNGCKTVPTASAGLGYCSIHYKRLRKYGDPRGARIACAFCDAGFYPVNSLRKACDDCMAVFPRAHGTTAAKIAQRDGDRCGLCCQQVDLRIPWPNPLSAAVDHIVPWSRGGTHHPENLQLTHLKCNASKGNRV